MAAVFGKDIRFSGRRCARIPGAITLEITALGCKSIYADKASASLLILITVHPNKYKGEGQEPDYAQELEQFSFHLFLSSVRELR